MITVRKKDDRGITHISWLKSYHSFSFGDYHDPKHMGFGPLRVINEDWLAPVSGFDTHGHKNMEIITYVLEGELTHKDSLGTGSTIRPDEIQVMSAGKGIRHSEFNSSDKFKTHLLQIWILPDETDTKPGYQQKTFSPEEMQNRFRLLVSKDGRENSLVMRQNAKLLTARIAAGKSIRFDTESTRQYWLQIARGRIDFQEQTFDSGDGIAIEKEQGAMDIVASENAEVLLFDLPR